MPFHLTLRLGFPHPDYLLPYLSASQLLDWQRYAAQFGVSLDRADSYQAMLLSLLFNVHRGDAAARSPDDFRLWNRPEPYEDDVTQEDFVADLRAGFASILPRYTDGSNQQPGSQPEGSDW